MTQHSRTPRRAARETIAYWRRAGAEFRARGRKGDRKLARACDRAVERWTALYGTGAQRDRDYALASPLVRELIEVGPVTNVNYRQILNHPDGATGVADALRETVANVIGDDAKNIDDEELSSALSAIDPETRCKLTIAAVRVSEAQIDLEEAVNQTQLNHTRKGQHLC